MKKIFPVLMLACLSLTLLPQSTFAVSAERPGIVTTTTPAPATNAIVLRINEIKNMDKSRLSSSEKKALRQELRNMKREARRSGVFLTVGALLIVIVLLILLL